MNSFGKMTLLVIVFSTLTSCGEYELLEFQKDCQRVADSLYRAHRDSLNILADSLCTLKHDSVYVETLDSLKKIKREEIQKLLGQ